MRDPSTLTYVINDPIELNLSYIPFATEGGLFVPTEQSFNLGELVMVDLQLPARKESIHIEGKVIWITPKNALHHVLAGIGIQFIGANAKTIRTQIESYLDNKMEMGGYVYGITGEKPNL